MTMLPFHRTSPRSLVVGRLCEGSTGLDWARQGQQKQLHTEGEYICRITLRHGSLHPGGSANSVPSRSLLGLLGHGFFHGVSNTLNNRDSENKTNCVQRFSMPWPGTSGLSAVSISESAQVAAKRTKVTDY